MLQRQKGEKCAKESCKLKAYKKIIDGCIEPTGDTNYSRKIKLILPDGFEMGKPFQRPLRGQTAQGERIALASSEILPEGTRARFYIEVPDAYLAAVEEWLRYCGTASSTVWGSGAMPGMDGLRLRCWTA